MRRIVIVCLLLFLPLQWSWAALGGIGQHECGCVTAHAVDDACEHAVPDGPHGHCGGGGVAGAACGTDCNDCHGQSLTGLLGVPGMPLACSASPRRGDHARHFRNHIPDHPLRPPLGNLV